MLISEFIDRTGFRPTEDYYHTEIEPEYNRSNLNKDEWCKQWKRNGGIQKAYDAMCHEAGNNYAQVVTLQGDVKKLTEENHQLKDECDQLYVCKETAEDLEDEKTKTAEWLIQMADKWSATDLRDKAIEMLGEREYITYKLNNDMTLWQADKNLIIELLKYKTPPR